MLTQSANQIYTVTQVNQYIKGILDGDQVLQSLVVMGEISNFKAYSSGHWYFSLKDAQGTLSCVMFKGATVRLRFRPENGMKVIVGGYISAFPRDGKYQLYCQHMHPEGQGDLQVAFEQLKAKLQAEGLFDAGHKKPLPACPDTIAVITSPSGDAVRDIIRIAGARWPMTTIKVLGVRVQGATSAAELVGAIRYVNRWKLADLIIVGRGGGSMEDLWSFNDERLARAIYDSEIPVISAVGHEPDVLISDYVADRRASTPTNAAELAVPDQAEVLIGLNGLTGRLQSAMLHQLRDAGKRLDTCRKNRQLTSPEVYIQDRQLRLDHLIQGATHGFERILARQKQRLARDAAALDAMSPLKVLARGYSMTTTEDGTLLTDAARVAPGDGVKVRLQSGTLHCRVEKSEVEA